MKRGAMNVRRLVLRIAVGQMSTGGGLPGEPLPGLAIVSLTRWTDGACPHDGERYGLDESPGMLVKVEGCKDCSEKLWCERHGGEVSA